MSKSISQALFDEVHYPISFGQIENACIRRGLDPDVEFTQDVAVSDTYKGALADALRSLVSSVNFSEADKSVGNLTDAQRTLILKWANRLYSELGEDEVDDGAPLVEIIS